MMELLAPREPAECEGAHLKSIRRSGREVSGGDDITADVLRTGSRSGFKTRCRVPWGLMANLSNGDFPTIKNSYKNLYGVLPTPLRESVLASQHWSGGYSTRVFRFGGLAESVY